jgi:hypothetical protein
VTPIEAEDPAGHPATWAWSLFTGAERAQLGGDHVRWWQRIGRARRTELRAQWQRARAAQRDATRA